MATIFLQRKLVCQSILERHCIKRHPVERESSGHISAEPHKIPSCPQNLLSRQTGQKGSIAHPGHILKLTCISSIILYFRAAVSLILFDGACEECSGIGQCIYITRARSKADLKGEWLYAECLI